MAKFDFILSNNIEEIRGLMAAGYCPIECSIGGESIVDSLQMDHHGTMSNMEPVSIRAYRDHYGSRSADPRFVTTGTADADATFTAAALAGLLPHPKRQVPESTPPPVKTALTRDLMSLAETVARVDLSPIGLDIPSLPFGDMLLTWNAMSVSARDSLGFAAGVGLWRSLCEGNPSQLGPFLSAAKVAEENRRRESLRDLNERSSEVSNGVLLVQDSRTFGFPEWYSRQEDAGKFEEVAGWRYPVVLAHLERGRNITMGCPNQEVAEKLFGPGGLKNVFPHLKPEGWGGREAVGGSPRGVELTEEQACEAALTVAMLIRK